jgi:hypothetical protein
MNVLLVAALYYAKAGWPVFPVNYPVKNGNGPGCSCENAACESPAKHPIGAAAPHGQNDATTDEAKIRGWWARWPKANIGLLCNASSGRLAIDLDGKNAKDALKQRFPNLDFESIPRQRSGRPEGGWHLVFEHPGGVVTDEIAGLTKIDVKGNGYILGAPSVHMSGKNYGWEVPLSAALPALPEELRKVICSPANRGAGGPREKFDTTQALAGVPEGQRDETLFKLACKLRHADVPEAVSTRLVLEAARNCSPPFSERIALEKVERAYEKYWPKGEGDDEQKKKSDPLKIETLGDLWRKDIPERESFLGGGLIARGDLNMFSGPQKKGKSLAALNQALCLARGEKWLDFDVPKAIRVGIIQQEIPEGALKERLQKMLGAGMRDVPFLDSVVHCSRQGLKLDTTDGLDFLRRWLDVAKIDLLQLDPLYTLHTGDENNAKDMGRLFSPLKQIVREYSIAIEIIHHHGKPGQVEREGGDLHRGTSLMRDVTDANWTFTRVPANKLALAEPPSHYVYLNFEQRHSAAPDPVLLHLDPETLWFEQVDAIEVREVKVEQIVEEITKRAGECLQDDLIKVMTQKLGAKERSTRYAIYEARDQGLIEADSKGRKRVWKIKRDVGGDTSEEPCQLDLGNTHLANVE